MKTDLEKVNRLISRALRAALYLDDDVQWWMREHLPKALAAEREELLKEVLPVLEFYARERLYVNIGMPSDMHDDSGKRARALLAKLRGGE